jgi:hypothetical protein
LLRESELPPEAAVALPPERTLRSLEILPCPLPQSALPGCRRRWSKRSSPLDDRVVEAVGLDAACGLLPFTLRTSVLWSRTERGAEVWRLVIERLPQVLLAEHRELVLEGVDAVARCVALRFLPCSIGRAAGKLLLACCRPHDLSFGRSESLALKRQRGGVNGSAPKNAPSVTLKLGDPSACVGDDAFRLDPRLAYGDELVGLRGCRPHELLTQRSEFRAEAVDRSPRRVIARVNASMRRRNSCVDGTELGDAVDAVDREVLIVSPTHKHTSARGRSARSEVVRTSSARAGRSGASHQPKR